MSGAKHTPGPWRDVGDGYVEAQSAPLKFRSGWYDSAYLTADSKDEWEANARLIAAAPELLEALEGLLEYCGGSVADEHLDEDELKAARAAIAKARGEA